MESIVSLTDEYVICVFLRQIRNANPLCKTVIDWTGKSAWLQLEPEALAWYSQEAANEESYA